MKAGEKAIFKGIEVIAVHDEKDSYKGCVFDNITITSCSMVKMIGLDCFKDKIIFKVI